MKVNEVIQLGAVKVDFADEKDFYLRLDPPGMKYKQWCRPLMGPDNYGFELVMLPKMQELEKAYQEYVKGTMQ